MPSDEIKSKIQSLYRELVQNKSLTVRHGQKVMIAEVAKTFSESANEKLNFAEGANASLSPVCVIEAGTGTGKTLAYTVAALPVAIEQERQLVISTATVALQEQLVNKDLPDIKKNCALDFNFALVKGRARYVCLQKLYLWQEGDQQNVPLFFDDALEGQDAAITKESLKLYRKMITLIDESKWDGERDHWKDEIEHSSWRNVMANRQDCSGKKCSYYSQCSFFEARKKVADADCIVTNHDLVMADLVQGEGGILPSVEDAFYIFDEAHHLPAKALGHFSYSVNLKASQVWLARAETFLQVLFDQNIVEQVPKSEQDQMLKSIEVCQALLSDFTPFVENYFRTQRAVNESKPGFKQNSNFNEKEYVRFEDGVMPFDMKEHVNGLQVAFSKLGFSLNGAIEHYKEQAEFQGNESIINDLSGLASLQERAEDSAKLFLKISGQYDPNNPDAKWVAQQSYSDHIDFQLAYSPLMARHLLDELVWGKCLGIIITSATLTALGNFGYFKERSGVPDNARYFQISSPFNYQDAAKLVIPKFHHLPNDGLAFAEEAADYIAEWYPLSFGTLVLFSSWKQLNEVRDIFLEGNDANVLIQGDLSKEEILLQHKKKIDDGQYSVIFGLASFAEGIDLPGEYLTHVIICKIPFSVPTDPLEESLAEWVSRRGGNPFNEISVPDASLKLIQACGRLLRSESDTGRISILDRRIIEKSYGKKLIAALPPYKIVQE